MPTDFAATKAQFLLPQGVTYLDGNSLGPLPRAAAARVAQTITAEWGEMLIGGWTKAGWMDQPSRVGDRIARLIGAEPGHVVMGDRTRPASASRLRSCRRAASPGASRGPATAAAPVKSMHETASESPLRGPERTWKFTVGSTRKILEFLEYARGLCRIMSR